MSERRCYGHQSRFPCSLWWRSWWVRLSLKPMKILAVAGRAGWEKAVTTCGACDSVWSLYWRRLGGPVATWGKKPALEQVFWKDLWPHGESMLEQFLKDFGGTPTGAQEECEEESSSKDVQWTPIPIPHPPVPLERGGDSKVKPGKLERKIFLGFCFISPYLTRIWFAIK